MTKISKARMEFVRRALKNSKYITQAGDEAFSYINLDDVIFGDDRWTSSQGEWLRNFLREFATRIRRISRKQGVSRLAFIDKGGQGPVGILPLASQIMLKCKIDAILVKPYKRTLRSMIRGQKISQGEKILILSDVTTSGRTVFAAAEAVRMQGGNVKFAFVAYDQGCGARENLAQKDIKLFTFMNRKAVENIREQAPDVAKAFSPPAPSFIEYGAVI